ncbi:MAG: PepSY domain-containing protein, partial [Lachnospiraceae bacterium]|nr:PepSY domain-containing protein [Lachnospiraceae bacterium]
LSEDLNTYLESSSIGAAIVGQYVQADDDVRQFADKNGISDGKAWMIRQLVAGDKRLKEESLLKLSTQELLVLWTNRKTDSSADSKEDGQILFGKVSTKKYVSKQQALAAALNHVGIKRTQASDVEVEYECEDGVIVYEVNFTYGGREYEIDIQAETGTVLGGGPGESSEFTGTPAADGAAAAGTVSGQSFTGQDDDDGPDDDSDDLYDNEADDADDDADDDSDDD